MLKSSLQSTFLFVLCSCFVTKDMQRPTLHETNSLYLKTSSKVRLSRFVLGCFFQGFSKDGLGH